MFGSYTKKLMMVQCIYCSMVCMFESWNEKKMVGWMNEMKWIGCFYIYKKMLSFNANFIYIETCGSSSCCCCCFACCCCCCCWCFFSQKIFTFYLDFFFFSLKLYNDDDDDGEDKDDQIRFMEKKISVFCYQEKFFNQKKKRENFWKNVFGFWNVFDIISR